MESSRGERNALVGFGGQFMLAAQIVLAKLSTLEWIRLADPTAGVADDFQFKSGPRRYALQVKWSELPGTYKWSMLATGEKAADGTRKPPLLAGLAAAWKKLRDTTSDPLSIYLCTNNHASPNADRGNTSPLSRATVEYPHSLANFVVRSFQPVRERLNAALVTWSEFVLLEEVTGWRSVWDAMRILTNLSEDEFVAFIRDFEMKFGIQTQDPMQRPDQNPQQSDLAHLAYNLQKIIEDPAQPVLFSRDEFLHRLGWSGYVKYRHRHQFPIPTVYAANQDALTELVTQLDSLAGGYAALVGPAGSGKSTLLASLELPANIVRYYAFVPDAPDPLSGRGEADSFLHDITLALEEAGLPRRGVGNDIKALHAILVGQLDAAGRLWTAHGTRTIIVVDGLDHIAREQNPVRSLLDELPAPAALPAGVFIVLGTQTTHILPAQIQEALAQQHSVTTLVPLEPEAVEQIAALAGVDAWMHAGQISDLVEASEGHPLALTYILEQLSELAENEPDEETRRRRAVQLLGEQAQYKGNITARYRGYYSAVATDPQVVELLGMVARLRVPVNLQWLKSWAQPQVVEAFVTCSRGFFRRAGDDWSFIHNSFRRFLVDQTASLDSHIDKADDRQFHHALAEVCARAGDQWHLYRDEEITHRFLAGENARVLDLAHPTVLRAALVDLQPIATVKEHARLGLRAAAAVQNVPAVIRALILINELWLRELALEATAFAPVVQLFDPPLAMEHIMRGGRLRIDAATALGCAVKFATDGGAASAHQILRACGDPARFERHPRSDTHPVADWAETTWALSGLDAVLTQLDDRLALPDTRDELADGDTSWVSIVESRDRAHARCFDRLVEWREGQELDALTDVIDAESSPSWRARARYKRAEAAATDKNHDDLLHWIQQIIALDTPAADSDRTDDDDDDDASSDRDAHAVPLIVRIAAAELLVANGFGDLAEVETLVPSGTIAAWPSDLYSDNVFRGFETVVRLWRLRVAKPDPAIGDLNDLVTQGPSGPVTARIRRGLLALAHIEGQNLAVAAGAPRTYSSVAMVDPIMRIMEVPLKTIHQWTRGYQLSEVAHGLFERAIAAAAAAGGDDLSQLLARFDTAWTSPERARYWPPRRRQPVIGAAVNSGALDWATNHLEFLDTEIDHRVGDAHDKVALWLAQARLWAQLQQPGRARQAASAAVRDSLFLGITDFDEQLSQWPAWLAAAQAAGRLHTTELDAAVRTYAARLASAREDQDTDTDTAAAALIALAFERSPAVGCNLAEWLCETGTITEESTIQAIVEGSGRHLEIEAGDSVTTAVHMLYPIIRRPSESVLQALESRASALQVHALAEADSVFALREEPREAATYPASPLKGSGQGTVIAPGALLQHMKKATTSADAPPTGWQEAVRQVASISVPATMATALLAEATRLQLDGVALGTLAALAARRGCTALAVAALSETLGRTSGYGWIRQHDGGSRLALFSAALQDRDPELVALAWQDLANAVASRAMAGSLSPTTIATIVGLLSPHGSITGAWGDVADYLDLIAPARIDAPDFTASTPAPSATVALAQWIGRYLGHPVPILDFGARRALQLISRPAADKALQGAIGQGGWAAEAALLSLLTRRSGERDTTISTDLAAAIFTAALGGDSICRYLARRVAAQYGLDIPAPAARPLPPAYLLALPTPPVPTSPVCDSDGMRIVDMNNPRDVVAPYDRMLDVVAAKAGLQPAAVVHRAATIALTLQQPWLVNGPSAQKARLKTRRQRHYYRMWSYMVGRRAIGQVLAELTDAGRLGTHSDSTLTGLGLIDLSLSVIDPQPVPGWIPAPWRPDGTTDHDTAGWCEETPDAAETYRHVYRSADTYVLAETAEWQDLQAGIPCEQRDLVVIPSGAETPLGPSALLDSAWDTWVDEAGDYPHSGSPARGLLFVVRGHQPYSDAVHRQWLALHPRLGQLLGWVHDADELFTWKGSDGLWRARTRLFKHGQLGHETFGGAACAQIWQVQLSERGHRELSAEFPDLTTYLHIARSFVAMPSSQDTPPPHNCIVEIPTK
ncbi:hypothetical protein [Nocardia xishanensis]